VKTILNRVILESNDSVVDNSSIGIVMHSDTATDLASYSSVFTHLENFLNVAAGTAVHPICYHISKVMSRGSGASTIEAYDITTHLDGSAAGSPVAMTTFTLGNAGTGFSLPEGLAIAISYRSDYGTDVEFGPGTRPRSRDRGRLYIGPLTSDVVDFDTTTFRSRILAQVVTDFQQAMFALSSSVTAGGDEWVLRQWSRKNAAIKLPTECFMDNRFDYQRRRSDPAPGTRTYLPLASV